MFAEMNQISKVVPMETLTIRGREDKSNTAF